MDGLLCVTVRLSLAAMACAAFGGHEGADDLCACQPLGFSLLIACDRGEAVSQELSVELRLCC
jgi:hypothetical protein